MPRRALRCVVDLQLSLVSAPGVWLPCKEDVYLSVSLFNQYRNTRLLTSTFPCLIGEKFRFEKTYYTAIDPSQVAEMLADELVIFELVQLSEYSDGAVRLASYCTNARDFLYPYPTLAPSYSAHDREVLMCRTVAFPGISPKLEFTSKTIIKESISPELDALDDAIEQDSRSRSKSRRRPSSRARSLSPTRRVLADVTISDTIDPRPPFVVRKLGEDLIGRKPGDVTDKAAESKPRRSMSPVRSLSPTRSIYRPVSSRPLTPVFLSTSPSYKLETVIRDSYGLPLPVYRSSILDDLDLEVSTLTSTTPSYRSYLRSKSPVLYRSSYRERYGYDPVTLDAYPTTYYETLAEQRRRRERTFERILDEEREANRSRRLGRIYTDYHKSIDDLDLELRLARLRASRLL